MRDAFSKFYPKRRISYNMVNLPVFFFHGALLSSSSGIAFEQFATEQRPVIPLSFAEGEDSIRPVPEQIQLAIEQIRNYTYNDSRFDNGYNFIGHSLGGIVARAVVEDMDDHNVHKLITLASLNAGICYGPQASPLSTQQWAVSLLNGYSLPAELVNFSSYSIERISEGHLLTDLMETMKKHPELTQNSSINSVLRYPVRKLWLDLDPYLATLDNLEQQSGEEQKRRKSNFLKLREFHAFTSPQDGMLEPYQSGVFSHYAEVADSTELLAKFKTLGIVEMENSVEYQNDTYGLRTLDERGGLFRYVVEQVPHMCWVEDTGDCSVKDLLATHLGPVINYS